MKSIANFFTLFWIIYFPTCIAFNEVKGLSSVDEAMLGILILYTWMKRGKNWRRNAVWKEYFVFLCILMFYVVYSLIRQVNVPHAAFLDFIQQLRPYSVIYCTWLLNPQFNRKQKKLMVLSMVLTMVAWYFYHPEVKIGDRETEFPVLGQLAICTGMSWYLFSKDTRKNRWIALVLVCVGLLAPKMKFIGELVCFVVILFYFKKKINFKSSKTIIPLVVMVVAVLFFSWSKFDYYYVSGMKQANLARPMTYKTSLVVLKDYIPFGPGLGTFATNGAWKDYSPLYSKYHLDKVWGLNKGGGFICDAFYPSLAEFGIVGVVLFGIYWRRRLKNINSIADLKHYKVAMLAFFCLAIEQAADSSWLSGKGMGYCMILALCLCYNQNNGYDENGVPLVREEEKEENI